MRTIGLLGGMSWESTAVYYRLVNEGVRDALGGLHSARVVVDSLDFAEVADLQSADRWDDAADLLADHARGLVRAGAGCVLLCTNTMHLVADRVRDAVEVPLLHIGDATADAALAAGTRRVGLLGTAFTMERPFMLDHLAARGVDAFVPGPADRALVHEVIYAELVRGVVREESRRAYVGVVHRLVASGAEAVVLGCTEIELLLRPQDSPVPVLPTTRLHAEAAVRWALDG